MTITEVTMARLYNWDVKKRKEGKKGESSSGAVEDEVQHFLDVDAAEEIKKQEGDVSFFGESTA